MRVLDELRGSSASFSRASKRSSSGRLSLLAIAFNASRLAAYCLTSFLTCSLRFTALFLAIVLTPPLRLHEGELEFLQKRARFLVGLGGRADHDVHAPD